MQFVLSVAKDNNKRIELFRGGIDYSPGTVSKANKKRKMWGAKEYNKVNEFYIYIDVEMTKSEFEALNKILIKDIKRR